jgi:UDP-N-acetylmuramate dehydrogenase
MSSHALPALSSSSLPFESCVDLTSKHSFGFPAQAQAVLELTGSENLAHVFETIGDRPRWILGEGSNTLFCEPFEGVVLHHNHKGKRWLSQPDLTSLDVPQEAILRVGAGENWHELVSWTLSRGWNGLENLALIPGSVGAAPVQNIGAYGKEFADLCVGVCVWDIERGEALELSHDACDFAYRSSIFKQQPGRYLIQEVDLKLSRVSSVAMDYGDVKTELASLTKGEPTSGDVARAVCAIRRRKLPDPSVLGNAGSFFKNPTLSAERVEELLASFPKLPTYPAEGGMFKCAAGWMIDHLGWKGHRREGVGVHERQALVLVHEGSSTVQALLSLAKDIQDSVLHAFGVLLEPEVQMLGHKGRITLADGAQLCRQKGRF